jgi:ABC-type glycerol-3-phosphate transport system substrate-binding protein
VEVLPEEEPAAATAAPLEPEEAEEPDDEEAPAEAEPGSTQAPPAEPTLVITLDFQGYGPIPGADSGVALDELLANYRELHPQVEVRHTPVDPSAWQDIQQWTEARLVARDGPDLLLGNWPDLVERWAAAGLVGSWDPYLAASNSYVPGNRRWGDQFILPLQMQSNGTTAAIGLDGTAVGVFYNRDIFAQLGLEPPATWSEQTQALRTIERNNKIACGMYYGLEYAVLTFDAVANQLMHELFREIAGGEQREPSPSSVARAVVDGKYGITSPEYQDSLRIATAWWQYAPEGAAVGTNDVGQVLFVHGEAATRLATTRENDALHREVVGSPSPFGWDVWPLPAILEDTSRFSIGVSPIAVFPEGYLHYIVPAYTDGQKRDQAADFLMFLSAPENLGALLEERKGLVPNIRGTPMPTGLEALGFVEDVPFRQVNSLRSTHVNAEMRDAWVQNWRLVLLGEMSIDEYTTAMQLLLEEAARAELQ